MAYNSDHEFPITIDQLLGTMASICAARGAAREVAVLAVATGSLKLWNTESWDRDLWTYHLLLQVPTDLFARLRADQEALQQSLLVTAREALGHFANDDIEAILVGPEILTVKDWRGQALAWLKGEGINNQGRVRSDNIATRIYDGLLFRSEPEIHLYRALKSAGVSVAPLPVFVRGGAAYRRIEPDFVVVQDGVMMAVEVDGDTVHRETPAEAHDRTAMLAHEGVAIERVKASDCDTPEKAKACAAHVLGVIKKVKSSRG